MKALSLFYPYILPDVIGCPNPLVDNALRIVAREFCQKTRAIREWSSPLTATGAFSIFDFDIPTGQELVKALRAVVNDEDVTVVAYAELPSDWQAANPANLGEKVVQLDQTTYQVFPAPAAGDVITMQIATKPTIDAATLHDDLLSRYADEIAAGVKARLMVSAGNAWSNVPLAGVFKAQFNAAMNSAANEDIRQRSELRVKRAVL